MQTETLNCHVALKDAIRNHFTMASQMFLHELILQKWGETGICERIDREFCPDMSRAFRLLEHLLARGGRVELGTSDGAYSKHLPKVGKTVPDMLARDRDRLKSFQPYLRKAIPEFEAAKDDTAAMTLREGVRTRAAYIEWLEATIAAAKREVGSHRELIAPGTSDPARAMWEEQNLILCQLHAVVDQTLCHAFVLKHLGERSAAAAKWRASFRSMMDATLVANALVERGWSFELDRFAAKHGMSNPMVEYSLSSVSAIDEVIHRRAVLAAERCTAIAGRVGDSLVGATCSEVARTQTVCAAAGLDPASLPAAQRPFTEMLEGYAYRPDH